MPHRKPTKPTNTKVTPDQLALYLKLSKVEWFAVARDMFEEFLSNEVDPLDCDGNLYDFTAEVTRRVSILNKAGIIYKGSSATK